MSIKIVPALPKHAAEIEKIHLAHFSCIGEKKGCIKDYTQSEDMIGYVAMSGVKVVGYMFFEHTGDSSFLVWFGVSEGIEGVSQKLVDTYSNFLKKNKIKTSFLVTRNRFKKGISFYLKNGYDINGTSLASNGDLLIQLKKTF